MSSILFHLFHLCANALAALRSRKSVSKIHLHTHRADRRWSIGDRPGWESAPLLLETGLVSMANSISDTSMIWIVVAALFAAGMGTACERESSEKRALLATPQPSFAQQAEYVDGCALEVRAYRWDTIGVEPLLDALAQERTQKALLWCANHHSPMLVNNHTDHIRLETRACDGALQLEAPRKPKSKHLEKYSHCVLAAFTDHGFQQHHFATIGNCAKTVDTHGSSDFDSWRPGVYEVPVPSALCQYTRITALPWSYGANSHFGRPPKTSFSIRLLTASSGCHGANLDEFVEERKRSIEHCFLRGLRTHGSLKGSLGLDISIDAGAGVTNIEPSHNTIEAPPVEQCVMRKVRAHRFGRPEGECSTFVLLGFMTEPAHRAPNPAR